ncbi:MAG: hypothetical protein LUG89_04740 [Methanosphaera sp.]|nr:hypothetical protein [Methanosphaera sp.]
MKHKNNYLLVFTLMIFMLISLSSVSAIDDMTTDSYDVETSSIITNLTNSNDEDVSINDLVDNYAQNDDYNLEEDYDLDDDYDLAEDYDNNTTTDSIDSKSAKSLVSIELSTSDITCYYGDEISIDVATIPAGITDGIINYYIDSDLLGFQNLSISQDSFTYDTSDYDPGEYQLIIDYSSSTIYENTIAQATLTINKLPTTLTIEQIELDDNNDINITLNLYSNDVLLTQETLEIYSQDELIESVELTGYNTSITLPKEYNYQIINFKYGGDSYHDSLDLSYLVYIEKMNCSISIPYTSGYVGSTINQQVSISSDRKVNDGVLDVYINDTLIDEYQVIDSIVDIEIDLSGYTEGNYTLSVKYVDSDIYEDATKTTTLRVSKIKTTLYSNNITSYRNSVINITASLYNYVDSPDEGLIEFFIDSESIMTANIDEGKASMSYTIPDTMDYGVHELEVVYYGTERYASASNTNTLNITKYSSYIYLRNTSLNPDGTITLNISLYSYYDDVSDGLLDVIIDGETIDTITVSDNTIEITLPSQYTTGNSYELDLSYHDSDWFADSSLSDTISIDKYTTTLRLYTYLAYNNTLTITSYVYSQNYDNVSQGVVSYYIDDVLVGTVDVSDNKAVLTYDMSEYTYGNHTIEAIYEGSSIYDQSLNQTTVEKVIRQSTMYITSSYTIKTTPGETITINATLADYEGNLANGTIQATITIDGMEYDAQFVDGVLVFNYDVDSSVAVGNYPITINTTNTTYYKNATRNMTLSVEKNYTYISSSSNLYATKNTVVLINATLYSNNAVVTYKTPAIIKINDKLVYNGYFVDGLLQYELNLTNKYTADAYNITIIAQETTKYSEASKIINITLKKRNTYINSSNVYSTSGDKIIIKATVYDYLTKQPIVGQSKLCIKINQVTLDTITINNGELIYEYSNNYSAKTYNITIISGENTIYNTSQWDGYLIVNKTYIKIATQNIKTDSMSNITISAKLLVDDNLINETLKTVIKIDGKTIATVNATAGQINLPFNLTSDYTAGVHNITIKTTDTTEYLSSTTTSQLIISRSDRLIETTNITSKANQTIHIKANITDSEGNLITSTTKVNIKIAGNSIITYNVTGGVIDYEYTLPSDMKAGYYDVLIQAGQTSIYNHATMYTTLKVE